MDDSAFSYSLPEGLSDPSTFVARVPTGLSSHDELQDALFWALRLPGWYGFNWNAMYDSLSDYHWLEESRVVLIHEDLPGLPEFDLDLYLDILACCVEELRGDPKVCLTVVFPPEARARIKSARKPE